MATRAGPHGAERPGPGRDGTEVPRAPGALGSRTGPGAMVTRGPGFCSALGAGTVITERAVPQGAGQALAVGSRVLPQSSIRGSRGPGQARLQSTALLYWALWTDSGQGRAVLSSAKESPSTGWAVSHDPQVIGTAVVCGEGWTQLQNGDTTGAAPLQGGASAPP